MPATACAAAECFKSLVDDTCEYEMREFAALELCEYAHMAEVQAVALALKVVPEVVTIAVDEDQPFVMKSCCWQILGGLQFDNERTAAIVHRGLDKILGGILALVDQMEGADTDYASSVMVCMGNLLANNPPSRPRCAHLATWAIRWSTCPQAPKHLTRRASSVIGHLSKDPQGQAAIRACPFAGKLIHLALDQAAPWWRRGAASSALLKCGSHEPGAVESLVAAGLCEEYVVPTIQAAVERRKGPDMTFPALDTVALVVHMLPITAAARRFAEAGGIVELVRVLKVDSTVNTAGKDSEGKWRAWYCLWVMLTLPELRFHVLEVLLKTDIEQDLALAMQCDEWRVRREATKVYYTLNGDEIWKLLLVGKALSAQAGMCPVVFAQSVLPNLVPDMAACLQGSTALQLG